MASATIIGRAGPELRIGDVFSRAFALWQRLVVPFSPLYALGMIPTVIQTLSADQAHLAPAARFGWSLAIATLLAGIIGLISHGAVVDGASREMDGTRPPVMTSVNLAMQRFLPLLGAWICAGAVIMLGFVLLVVPGFIAYTALFVVTPVCVLERLGATASLGRSAELTRGSRWRIFALVLIVGLLGGVTSMSVFVGKAILGPVGGGIAQIVVSAAIGLFGTIVAVVVHRDLVAAKDGFGGTRIASVF